MTVCSCAVCGGALVVGADTKLPKVPNSPTRNATERIAKRQEPRVAAAFLSGIDGLTARIDDAALQAAIAGGNIPTIEAVAGVPNIGPYLTNTGELFDALLGTSTLTGRAATDILEEATGLESAFNAKDPAAVLFAQEQSSTLIVQIADDAKTAVRSVIKAGQEIGLTPLQQSRMIRDVVGLPPNWVDAPLALRQNLLDGNVSAATNRRLSAVDKARIRKRIREGTVDEAFIAEMEGNYSRSLLNRRAQNIARTETMRAANYGQHNAWQQAQREGTIPASARRIVIVTPDDRLRETHAQIAITNSKGVKIGEPFSTSWGMMMDPPWETLCRCGTALIFPGLIGVL